ncbi:MAG TPA: glycosyltransferase [Gemmatimonadaceae bacterium]|nr:glycosyltransferase [Gemmatimonadaceae bacterium]
MTPANVLTLSILTIPEREAYLKRLLQSISTLELDPLPRVDVIYNRPLNGSLGDVEAQIRAHAPNMPIDIYCNAGETSIVGGRNLQLSVCRTPLIAFVDDDITLHGDIVPAILETLAEHPVGMIGFPSFKEDTNVRIKPRDSTPSVEWHKLRYSPVQGMLCAGYRALFADVGGFNPRRRYWGEWTEMNLRLWRSGFPTAYQMERGFLRHWQDAPSSPTRNMEGREQHVVWGLICTALEYDAVDVNEATAVFWRLVEERYLAYSYGTELTPRNVLKTVLELVPNISAQWGSIQAFRAQTAQHPFKFAPFHRFTRDEVKGVIAHARDAISQYRSQVRREVARSSGGSNEVVIQKQETLRNAVHRLSASVRRLRARFQSRSSARPGTRARSVT